MAIHHFAPRDTFESVRERMEGINAPENRLQLARLSWLEGNAKGESITFLYDEMADRFGHTIDKSALHHEVLTSLYNGVPVDVELIPRPKRNGAGAADRNAEG